MSEVARKLGIQGGHRVCLLNAPSETNALLRQECPPEVVFSETLGKTPYHLILFWPLRKEGLAEQFALLQRHIVPAGAVWAVLPKKSYAKARSVDLNWREMQEAALQTDLVDNKDASLSKEEYATRFVIRKESRPSLTSLPR